MDQVITKERLLLARDNEYALQSLTSQTQVLLVMLYMNAADDKQKDGEDEPEGIVCTRCGELTLYSSADLLPCADFAKMCLSAKCISSAILEMANTLEPGDTSVPPSPQTDNA